MKRGVLIVLILSLIAAGAGFLALMWIDMRNSIHNQPQRQSSIREPRRERQDRPDYREDRREPRRLTAD